MEKDKKRRQFREGNLRGRTSKEGRRQLVTTSNSSQGQRKFGRELRKKQMIRNGNQNGSQKRIKKTESILGQRRKTNPNPDHGLNLIQPRMETKSIQKGNRSYKVPRIVSENRSIYRVNHWTKQALEKNQKRKNHQKWKGLCLEILDREAALNGSKSSTGTKQHYRKERERRQNQVLANRMFSL